MKVLIVKTTSMGDVIHTLPALTDAGQHIPNIRFDWVVEKPFAEIPALHPLVDQVIPVQIRQWRKHWLQSLRSDDWKRFRQQIKAKDYDVVIDAQGLVKSALIARMAKGERYGLNWSSAREPLASLFYHRKVPVKKGLHAIYRVRKLFAEVLGYDIDEDIVEYSIDRSQLQPQQTGYITFLHGTTWLTKHWPEAYWCKLAKLMTAAGYPIKLPWGNEAERARAQRIAAVDTNIEVLPKLNLMGVAQVLAGSKAVIAVDTGLGHMAAALDVPTISLYGPTDPVKIGTRGASQIHVKENLQCDSACSRNHCALMENDVPGCFQQLTPEKVLAECENLVANSKI